MYAEGSLRHRQRERRASIVCTLDPVRASADDDDAVKATGGLIRVFITLKAGRDAEPSAAVIDTQTVKPPPARPRQRKEPVPPKGLSDAEIRHHRCARPAPRRGCRGRFDVQNHAGVQMLDQAKASHPTIVKTCVDAGFENRFVEPRRRRRRRRRSGP